MKVCELLENFKKNNEMVEDCSVISSVLCSVFVFCMNKKLNPTMKIRYVFHETACQLITE
jgi:hypothetical protein